MEIKRLILFIGTLLISVSMLMAQSSGDKLYNQGLQAQKTMTVKAQNEAIQKFTSAKKLYDSASKKAQCDKAISVSRNIITSLKSGNTGKGSAKGKKSAGKDTYEYVEPAKPKTTLSLTETSFSLDASTRTLHVGVNTNDPEWDRFTCTCDDGNTFLIPAKIADDELIIDVPENKTTIPRKQKIQVRAGDITEDIVVSQEGRPIRLVSNNVEFSFNKKGGKKNFKVTCNADQVYPENGYENWYVESQPDWVKLIVKEKKKKNLINRVGQTVGLVEKESSENVTSDVTIVVDPLKPGTREAETGQRGEIILRSGDQRVTLLVYEYGRLDVIP